MLVLGGIWLVLLIIELTRGLPPFAERLGTAIWIVFIADFVLRFRLRAAQGPVPSPQLADGGLAGAAGIAGAPRVRPGPGAFRLARVARGLRLVRVVGSLNRGMRTLDRVLRRRGFGYVMALTVLVALVGAAGDVRPGA